MVQIREWALCIQFFFFLYEENKEKKTYKEETESFCF